MKCIQERIVQLSLMLSLMLVVSCTELTFELEDNAKQCFHEVIKKDTKCTLEFQVVTGGHYDVDVTLKDPNGKILYDQQKKQYDSHQFKAEAEGEYIFCFGNEFSSFAHKTVYLDFQAGDEPPILPAIGKHHSALTQIETSASNIHEALKVVIDYQTHHRLREMTGREEAEYLNERVQYWSIGQTVLIILISVFTVYVVRNFFAEKRDRI